MQFDGNYEYITCADLCNTYDLLSFVSFTFAVLAALGREAADRLVLT